MRPSIKVGWMPWALILLSACSQAPEPQRPQQAGQPLDPIETAARLAALRGAAMTGDQEAVQRQFTALHTDMMRSMKVPDTSRRIDPEAARATARTVPGVRSVVWVDRTNLFAIVERNEQRSHATIDAICMALEPLGDTLAVVVNLQSGAARTGDELEILSRNCQLGEGDRALFQQNRQLDVVPPGIRAQHQAEKARLEARAARNEMSTEDEAALMAIPEM
ncbi:hypothetical protein [Marilutibacter alkalisoli]|uniref:Uncharacterized protein n=1 Tax=Marilutibacter alkalisoli TaxID=2591633 RepID=A0A514BSV9_9GAMM|nr:hypothetical protein [Lysobacter alkalisoli]QDH70473.1 hypothetical protein FKV23_10565 [Lysobacter alkalisoli]